MNRVSSATLDTLAATIAVIGAVSLVTLDVLIFMHKISDGGPLMATITGGVAAAVISFVAASKHRRSKDSQFDKSLKL